MGPTIAATRGRTSRTLGGSSSPVALPAAILLAGLLVFGVFAAVSKIFYEQSEQRLLEQRTAEGGAVLRLTAAQVRGPLSAAASVARVGGGDPDDFLQAVEGVIGEGRTFVGAALYRIGEPEALVTVGEPVSLDRSDGPLSVGQLLDLARSESYVIVDLLERGRRLGYGVTDAIEGSTEAPTYVVYAELQLNPDPTIRRQTASAFAQLDYAIYLDREEPGQLIGSSGRPLPIDDRRSTATVPFGNRTLLLVATPLSPFGSWLFTSLWWLVGVAGGLTSLAFSLLARQLLLGRDHALSLATDNERLYDEQRQIAQRLQLDLLPQQLDPPTGSSVAARYWPAGTASLIGGDFYDAFRIGDDRFGVVIGDVCGKGIEAAALTGLARHTLRAAARHATSPSEVLLAVHQAVSEHRPATFCTVCFFYVTDLDDGRQRIDLALGGHPPPLWLRRSQLTVEAVGRPGTLLGLIDPQLTDVSVIVEPGDTMVLYTDGLTDAVGDQAVPIEHVMDLLRAHPDAPLEELADLIGTMKRARRPLGSIDDTAILVLRFGPAALGAGIELPSSVVAGERIG